MINGKKERHVGGEQPVDGKVRSLLKDNGRHRKETDWIFKVCNAFELKKI